MFRPKDLKDAPPPPASSKAPEKPQSPPQQQSKSQDPLLSVPTFSSKLPMPGEDKTPIEEVLKNVGPFERLHKTANDLMETDLHLWTGIQLGVQNVLAKNFVTVHQLQYGKKETKNMMTGKSEGDNSAYTFTSYLKQDKWVLNGSMSSGLNTRATINYQGNPVSGHFTGQFAKDEWKNHVEGDITFNGRQTCTQLKFSSPGLLGFAYTQPLTKRYSMGCELWASPLLPIIRWKWLCYYNNKKTGLENSVYVSQTNGTEPDAITKELGFNYTKTIFPNFIAFGHLGLSFKESNKKWTSDVKVGAQFSSEIGGNVRSILDSNFTFVTLLEEPLTEAMAITASTKVNPTKRIYEFGLGVNISV